MRTFGFVILGDPFMDDAFNAVTRGQKREARLHARDSRVHLFSMDGRVKPGHDDS
jgi:hypothetical protein